MGKNPRINVTFSPKTYEQIKLLAHKQGRDMSEVVREWTLEGLNGTLNNDNIDIIVSIIREQLQDLMAPFENRMAKLSAKACVQSGTAAYLSAEAILRFVPPTRQEEVEITYELARKKAVAYLRGKEDLSE